MAKKHMKEVEQTIIAGPCAMETPEQMEQAVDGLVEVQQQVGHPLTGRFPLFKPRTGPGVFDGRGLAKGIPLLARASKEMPVGTEVLSVTQAWLIFMALRLYNPDVQTVFWSGARNQNHTLQQGLGYMPMLFPNHIKVLAKNQPWKDQKHLEGIGEHLKARNPTGKNVFLVDRGFSPQLPPLLNTSANRAVVNPHNFRNISDYDAIRTAREVTGVNILLDPSHKGGTRENVMREIAEGGKQRHDQKPLYSGMIVEAHPDPENAWTDALQQLQIGKPLVDAINLWLELAENSP